MSNFNPRRSWVPAPLRGWVLPLALLVLWWGAVASGWVNSPLLVSPLAVWQRGVDQVLSGELWLALSALVYFGVLAALGVPLRSLVRKH